MGIVIPRPPIRRKESRTIEANLRRHFELMKQYQEQGMSTTEASAKAYEDVKKGK